MQRDPKKYLSDMLDRAQFAVQLLADRSAADLESDRLLRSAIEREMMVLGEALYQLHRIAPKIAQRINRWDDIIGFRHILVHGYDQLEMKIIWDAVKLDVPLLIEQLNEMLTEKLV
ncbi:MAG: DUF86 domain-containing protein [Pirellulales bacterium]|nr:DUF86 domain-containing protein [Pirellulales bacterium]